MNKTDEADIRSGVRVILNRRQAAFEDFIAQIAARVPTIDAAAVANVYLKTKAAKFDGMRYTVKHGAFFDCDVIIRAAEYAATGKVAA